MPMGTALIIDEASPHKQFPNFLREAGKTEQQFRKEVMERLYAFRDKYSAKITRILLGFQEDSSLLYMVTAFRGSLDETFVTDLTNLEYDCSEEGWPRIFTVERTGTPSLKELRVLDRIGEEDGE